MHLTNYIAPLLIRLGSARENPVPSRSTTTIIPAAAPGVAVAGDNDAARFRYHFLLWNMTTETLNVHLGSSLAGCSSTYNNIGPGHAFERGNYHDKWDKGKICAGACCLRGATGANDRERSPGELRCRRGSRASFRAGLDCEVRHRSGSLKPVAAWHP